LAKNYGKSGNALVQNHSVGDDWIYKCGKGFTSVGNLGSLPIFWYAAWRHLIGRQARAALRVWHGGFG